MGATPASSVGRRKRLALVAAIMGSFVAGLDAAIARVAGLLAVAAIGAVVAAQFSSPLDRRLDGRALSAAAQSAVAQARSRTLARVEPARAGR